MIDRIEEWRIYAEVASRRSFAGAARALGRSPQAVTRAVAALERRVGTRLLNRTTRSVSLTDDGERYLERSRRAIAEVDALETPIDVAAELRGAVTVTAPVVFGQRHVVPIATAFLAQHAQVTVRLSLMDRVVSLAEEGVDLAVRIGGLPDSALRSRLVGHVRTVVCASPAYLSSAGVPRSLDALADHAAIAFTGTAPLVDRWAFPGDGKRERSVPIRARLVVNTAHAAIEAALAGGGLVRVLSYQVDALVAAGALRIVLARFEPPSSPVQLVHLPGVQTRAAIAFGALATQMLTRELASRTKR